MKIEEIRKLKYFSEEYIQKNADRFPFFIFSEVMDIQKYSRKFFEEFDQEISWDSLDWENNLDIEFIRKHKNKLNWMRLSQVDEKNHLIDKNFLQEFKDYLCWEELSFDFPFDIELVEKYKDKIWFEAILHNYNICESVIEQFIDHFKIEELSKRENLSNSFLKKYSHLLNWEIVSIYHEMEEKFLKEFGHLLNLEEIFRKEVYYKEEKIPNKKFMKLVIEPLFKGSNQ